MKERRIAVIGAGPAGLTAAYLLTKAGIPVDLYEASGQVGGLAKTISLWGQKVDLGPHRFFSSDPRVNKVWLEVAGSQYSMVNRLTRILYQKKFYHYPLKPWNAFKNLGAVETQRCVFSYAKQKVAPEKAHDNFESWVVQRFGRRLFEIFFKTYSEKLWGIPCTELDSDFAAQRIKKLSLAEAIKNAFGGAKGHKTLIDQFAYPHQGTGSIYERMAMSIRKHNGRVLLNSPIRRLINEGNRITGLQMQDGSELPYAHVISSMPLTLMVQSLNGIPERVRKASQALTYRNTILVYLNVDQTDLFPDNWLYVHSEELKVGRISNFRNWVPTLYGTSRTSILCLEYWANDGDPIWNMSDKGLIELAKKELAATGLGGGAPILDGAVHRLKRCYPVYRCGYKEPLNEIIDYLKGFENLQAIGRYGAFKYNNQDHSILMGILAAENIISSKRNDLWNVNTDYDYQESAIITETGLQPVSAPV